MSETKNLPSTLLEAVRYFADPDVANDFVASLRWPDGPECPSCCGKELGYIRTRRLWKCKNKECRRQFSVKVGTIFEDSPIPLDKWLASIWLTANAKNGISSHELGRSIGLTQKSAWFVLHRIRLAMQTGSFRKLSVRSKPTRRASVARPGTCTRASVGRKSGDRADATRPPFSA